MTYDFDRKIERKQNNSAKWDEIKRKTPDEDLLPMWMADMDFETAPEILEAMQEKLNHRIFGYTSRPSSYYESAAEWTKKIHDYEIKSDELEHCIGVIPAISILIRLLTKPDDQIIIQAPVYPPFFSVVEKNKRVLLVNNLLENEGQYTIDFEDFEEKAKDEKTKFFILCNPHNPVGRAWTKEELLKLGNICLKYNVRIISDDIWRDIIYKGHKYTAISSLTKEIEDITITCFSSTKTFNLAGLQASFVHFPRKEEQKLFNDELGILDIKRNTPFSLAAVEASFTKGEKWYRELMEYLSGNIDFVEKYLKENIPEISFKRPEATYLIWLDFRKTNLSEAEIHRLVREEAKLVLNAGSSFSEKSGKFQRINIAYPRDILEEALNRLSNAIKNINKGEMKKIWNISLG